MKRDVQAEQEQHGLAWQEAQRLSDFGGATTDDGETYTLVTSKESGLEVMIGDSHVVSHVLSEEEYGSSEQVQEALKTQGKAHNKWLPL